MPENVMDQIVAELRRSAAEHYPEHQEHRNVRVVGHTPKNDHYIYDMVVDFADGSERLAAKVYRPTKCGAEGVRQLARTEYGHLQKVHSIFRKKKLDGVPRPVGDFTELGAVVAEKLNGMPLQPIIMKAALLPGYADHDVLARAAQKTGRWLRSFHRVTADMPAAFDGGALLKDLERLCESCRASGLDDGSVRTILGGARSILARTRKALACSAVLNDFTPLNVIVCENGIGISDYGRMSDRGVSLQDAAMFLASVEALEKYPFCNRSITAEVQRAFLEAYGASATEQGILRVLKMRCLLGMFAQGRGVKESAVRKKVMWATVMKRFIHQAAERSLAPAA